METYISREYKGYEIEIHQDEFGEDPRENMDWIGTMVCFHPNYNLGDKHDYSPEGFTTELAIEVCPGIEDLLYYWNSGNGWEKFQSEEKSDAMIKKAVDAVMNKHYFLLPLYLYDHSGITMSTSPFSCQWDSGMVGAIFATWEKLRSELGEDCTKDLALGCLQNEVRIYDNYLCGEVFGYVIKDPEGEEIDDGSCWGYYGNPDESGLWDDATGVIDADIERKEVKEREIEHFFRNCWAY